MSTEAEQKRVTVTLTAADWRTIQSAWDDYLLTVPYQRQDERFTQWVPRLLHALSHRRIEIGGNPVEIDLTGGEDGWAYVTQWIAAVSLHGSNRTLAGIGAKIVTQCSNQTMRGE